MLALSMKTTILILLTAAGRLFGQETVLELSPVQTRVDFTLSDVLHTVHGSFKLRHGTVHYDFATSKCSGEIVIDAQSGDTGSAARDKRMHKNILESDRYPDIVFTPDRVDGTLSKANIHGMFRIHGQDHEMTMLVEAVPTADALDVTTHFAVPYVQWGMKNPSTLFLRVGDQVNIDVQAKGRIQPGS
jgi:polyisoprenoid-binding protein YceI